MISSSVHSGVSLSQYQLLSRTILHISPIDAFSLNIHLSLKSFIEEYKVVFLLMVMFHRISIVSFDFIYHEIQSIIATYLNHSAIFLFSH
jgi:hypothetical protein